ncbi:ankyrin repeat domain-containing protein [Streptomyces thermolilacinus]|uniref:ankyrin repeat domain-containing protein n=1 Tax=Streptomyces thermolilacinus TaxID=285540 RepID=UPI0033E90B76
MSEDWTVGYWTPAHAAVEQEDAGTLARLLADGVDPDEECGGLTLLTHAIDAEGDGARQSRTPLTVHTTAVLLAFGADPELPDPDGRTPMAVADHYGHGPAIGLLRAHIERRAEHGRGARRVVRPSGPPW